MGSAAASGGFRNSQWHGASCNGCSTLLRFPLETGGLHGPVGAQLWMGSLSKDGAGLAERGSVSFARALASRNILFFGFVLEEYLSGC